MFMIDVLILLGSNSDLPVTSKGLDVLKSFNLCFNLRIASAHRTPEHVHQLVKTFDAQNGKVLICVAGMSAHLAGVVAALTTLPVIAVPVAGAPTAGFDSLLSMSQMPAGIPVATMGFGSAGFINATLLAVQMISIGNPNLRLALSKDREQRAYDVITADQEHAVFFDGNRS
jgi:5-(carboxyamino)imidazole ribonucleotide mutase